MGNFETVGQRIAREIKAKNMTQGEAAAACKVSQQSMSLVVRDKMRVSVKMAAMLAGCFGAAFAEEVLALKAASQLERELKHLKLYLKK